MGFTDDFLDLLNDSVTVEPWDGTFDLEGQPNHSGPIAGWPCRVEERIRNVKDLKGTERVSTTTVYVAGGPFTSYDLFSLNGTPRMPVSVANHRDIEEAVHAYTAVYL